MALHAETKQLNDALLAARAAAPPPTPERLREGYALLMGAVATTPVSKVEEVDAGGLRALLFTPPEAGDGLCVWFHGGGFVISSPELATAEVDRLAVVARSRVLSVEYRLAPEHPLPAAQHDALAATRWALERAGTLGADGRRVAVGGDSAGGNLAAVAGQRVAGLRAQVLVYPAADLRGDRPLPHDEGYALDAATMAAFVDAAASGGVYLADPLVSPLLAPVELLAASPPTLLVTAEYDPGRDDARAYGEALRAAGVEVTALHFDDQMHLFFSLPQLLEGARTAIDAAGAFLVERLGA